MDRSERFYKIKRLLHSASAVPTATLLRELEVSRATLHRDLDYLRDRMETPIVFDPIRRGYRLDDAARDTERHELPGLWFSSRELHALLTFHHFLEHLEPGLLNEHIAPLKQRIEALLESKDQTLKEIARRIRILPQATRHTEPASFQLAAHALLTRKRLSFHYHGRARGDISARSVSPQRLVHYRDNWYLDAWDHGKRGLRTFAIDRIREPRILDERTKDIHDQRLDRHFTESYGIFAGKPKHKALLRFTPERACWVADEQWHPKQSGRFEPDGSYTLELPYGDARELVLDILKFGPDVEVVAPASLRREVAGKLRQAVQRYQDNEQGQQQ